MSPFEPLCISSLSQTVVVSEKTPSPRASRELPPLISFPKAGLSLTINSIVPVFLGGINVGSGTSPLPPRLTVMTCLSSTFPFSPRPLLAECLIGDREQAAMDPPGKGGL
jgi:hypothetical protein